MSTDTTLDLRLLGGFALHANDRPVSLGGDRLPALLAYLALHAGVPCSRLQVASAFWPEATEAQGLNNLRQLLHQLRQAWPGHEQFLASGTRAMEWLGGPSIRVDAVEFEHELSALRPAGHGDRRHQRDALLKLAGIYRGALLPDCYDDWVIPYRERLHRGALQVFEGIVRFAEEDDNHRLAIAHAERLLALDPLEERTWLRLMRLHALAGDRGAARSVYQACVDTLRRELEVAPGEEMQEAYRRLTRQGSERAGSVRDSLHPGDIGRHPARLVGRTAEWQALRDAWRRAEPGAGVLALITGEAGLGKTRLGEELLQWADTQGIAVARTRAFAAEGQLVFSPITGWLTSEPLRDSIGRLDPLWRTEIARLVPELLIGQPDLPQPAPLAEYWQRQRFFEAMARAVTTAGSALVLQMDDLQWCDGCTLEWLHYLLRHPANVRLMVIGTVRSDEVGAQHPVSRLALSAGRDGRLLELRLSPLDAAETTQLASAVAGAEIGADTAFRLYSQTEGNPLFVVETVRAGLPALAIAGMTTGQSLPPKVQAVIHWRLGQLSAEAREIAGLAAIIGRVFSIDILSAASDLGESRVQLALDELWQRRIVRTIEAEARAGRESWDFSHDRLREVAGTDLAPVRRRRFHLRVGEALELVHRESLDAVSARIASHFDAAQSAQRALPYYERAARVAAHLAAYEEVEKLLRRALALVRSHSGVEQDALELRLLLALYAALRVMYGWTSPRLEAVHERIGELARVAGNAEQRATALQNSIAYHTVRGDFGRVELLLAEVPTAMAEIESPVLRVMAHVGEVGAHLHRGRLVRGEAVFQESSGIYDPGHHRSHVELIGADYEVIRRAWSSHGLWCQGLTAAAFDRGHDAVALAGSLGHPFSESFAITYLAMLHQMEGDVERTRERAREALAKSEQHRVPYYIAWAGLLLAWAEAADDPADAQRIGEVRRRIGEFVTMGAGLRLPYFYCLLAALELEGGATGAALATVDLAISVAASGNNLWWEPELHRLRGEILHRLVGRDREALAEIECAVARARGQGAGRLEQRARESLNSFAPDGRSNA